MRGKGNRVTQATRIPSVYEKDSLTQNYKIMTTKKKGTEGEKETAAVKKTRKKSADETAGAMYCEFADSDNTGKDDTMCISTTRDEQDPFEFIWREDASDEKRKLAKDILIRLIDFNLEQLSRQDVDKVLIYDNPAEYAASVVNELYERIKE